MSLPDEGLELNRTDSLLELWRFRGVILRVRRRRGRGESRVPASDEPVGELEHLAFETFGGKGLVAGLLVGASGLAEVSLAVGGEGEQRLENRGHIAAKRISFVYIVEGDDPTTDLFPRFRRPVKPSPKTGCNSLPSSPVIEKSNFRLWSIFHRVSCIALERPPGTTYQLRHCLLGLALTANVQSQIAQVRSKLGVDFGIIAGVAVEIYS